MNLGLPRDDDEKNLAHLETILGAANDWYRYWKAGWGARRVVSVPSECLGTGDFLWTDYYPYFRSDLGLCIWVPMACGSGLGGESWRSNPSDNP